MKKRRGLGVLLGGLLVLLLVCRFAFSESGAQKPEQRVTEAGTTKAAKGEKTDEAVKKEEDTKELPTVEGEEALIWRKIIEQRVGKMDGVQIHNYGEELVQDDWLYVIEGAEVSKLKKESWDFVSDYEEYQYDENWNLVNEYSYLSVKISLTRTAHNRKGEAYMNSIWLAIFDGQGEQVAGGEVETADLHNPHTGSYFCCPLEVGESREVEIVYMVKDSCLQEENYYILDINNRGVRPDLPEHFSLVKLPLGAAVSDITDK